MKSCVIKRVVKDAICCERFKRNMASTLRHSQALNDSFQEVLQKRNVLLADAFGCVNNQTKIKSALG